MKKLLISMLKSMFSEEVLKAVVKAITKAPDKVIASDHESRLKDLEKVAHPQKDLVCQCCKHKECK